MVARRPVVAPVARNRSAGLLRVAATGAAAILFAFSASQAWVAPPKGAQAPAVSEGRRAVLGAGLVAALGGLPEAAQASGGSTAGKYSTIPSAKRRFFGRMREAIFEFLQMEKPITEGKLQDPLVAGFFAKSIIKIKGGVKAQGCAIDLGGCESKEQRTSRWNDMKAASDLLASAFRYSAEDRNDLLPQVRIIRKFHKKVEEMQILIQRQTCTEKNDACRELPQDSDPVKAKELYLKAKKDLGVYCPMVELSPIDSEDYTHEWDTAPQVICQGTFCV